MENILNTISNFVWGPPMLILLVGTGLFLTLRLKGLQFSQLFSSLYLALIKRTEKGAEGDVSHFQALMTALFLLKPFVASISAEVPKAR